MAINYPGPNTLKLFYSVDGKQHSQRINCEISGTPVPGTSTSTMTLVTKSGGTIDLDTAVDDYLNSVRGIYNTSVGWSEMLVQSWDGQGGSPTFLTSRSLNVVGSASAPANLAHQATVTFRTAEGNDMRLQFMESSLTGRTRVPVSQAGIPGIAQILAAQTGDDGWMLGQDTSYLIAGMNWSQTENEKLAKDRFR